MNNTRTHTRVYINMQDQYNDMLNGAFLDLHSLTTSRPPEVASPQK